MDRRNFVKKAGIISGLAIAGSAVTEVMAAPAKAKGEYIIQRKGITLNNEFEVIIIGGGPSGCAAAIAAAREGARTLLIEASGVLGGMGTAGLVPTWCPFSDREKIIYRGIAEKIFRESCKSISHLKPNQLDWVPINAESLKKVYDDMVIASGAQVLFFSRVADVVMRNKEEIESLIVANKAGLTAYQAKTFIDCTGDGDIAAWAGAPFHLGDEKGEVQDATLCMLIGNVDYYNYVNSFRKDYDKTRKIIADFVSRKEFPLLTDTHFGNTLVHSSIVKFNAGHISPMDGTNPTRVSEGIVEGRRIADQVVAALRKYFPETFGAAVLINTGTQLGVREGRRIEGDYIFTVDDFVARRSFDDEIGRNAYFIDIHKPGSKSIHYKKGESHGIPYRVLTPRGLKNVLVAGRAISVDAMAYGSLRVMPVCLVTGEAAGIASVHAARMPHPNVHSVDVQHLRSRLKEEGQYLL